MTNRYETPEVLEIGLAQDVVLGEKLGEVQFDSLVGQRTPYTEI